MQFNKEIIIHQIRQLVVITEANALDTLLQNIIKALKNFNTLGDTELQSEVGEAFKIFYSCIQQSSATPFSASQQLNLKKIRNLFYAHTLADINVKVDSEKTLVQDAIDMEDSELLKFLVDIYNAHMFVNDDTNGDTWLHYYIRNNDIPKINFLLETLTVNPNTKNKHGDTALMVAIRSENFSLVKLLIEKYRVKLHIQNYNLDNPLHLAATNKNTADIVKYLQLNKVAPHLKNKQGLIPLQLAAAEGHLGITRVLIKKFKETQYADVVLNPPFHCAVRRGRIDVLTAFLQENKQALFTQDILGNNGLHIAVFNNQPKAVNALIGYGLPISNRNSAGHTPLHLNVLKDDSLAMASLLIHTHKTEVEAIDNEGLTPLNFAVLNGPFSSVKYLVQEFKASPNIPNNQGRPPLFSAVTRTEDAIPMLQFLLENKADRAACDIAGNSILHHAAAMGHPNVIKFLLEQKLNLRQKNLKGYTPFHSAIAAGRLDVVEQFAKIDPEVLQDKDILGSSACTLAAENGRVDIMRWLKHEYKADLLSVDSLGENSIHRCARKNQQAALDFLFEFDEVFEEINSKNNEGQTAVEIAIIAGSLEALESLLIAGAILEVNGTNNISYLPWHAIIQGHTHIINWLIEEENFNNYVDNYGYNALHLAAECNRIAIAELLIKNYRVVLNSANKEGDTPLHIAAHFNQPEMVKLLLASYEILPNIENNRRLTPCHIAAAKGSLDILKLFNSPSLHFCSSLGKNALHFAVEYGQPQAVQFLINSYPGLNGPDFQDCLPLHLAVIAGDVNMVSILLNAISKHPSHSASLNACNDNNKTPYQLAKDAGHTEIINLIEKSARLLNVTLLQSSEKSFNMKDEDAQEGSEKERDKEINCSSSFMIFSLLKSASSSSISSCSPTKRKRELKVAEAEEETAATHGSNFSASIFPNSASQFGTAKTKQELLPSQHASIKKSKSEPGETTVFSSCSSQ
jgi:ankyrin repeat protein